MIFQIQLRLQTSTEGDYPGLEPLKEEHFLWLKARKMSRKVGGIRCLRRTPCDDAGQHRVGNMTRGTGDFKKLRESLLSASKDMGTLVIQPQGT